MGHVEDEVKGAPVEPKPAEPADSVETMIALITAEEEKRGLKLAIGAEFEGGKIIALTDADDEAAHRIFTQNRITLSLPGVVLKTLHGRLVRLALDVGSRVPDVKPDHPEMAPLEAIHTRLDATIEATEEQAHEAHEAFWDALTEKYKLDTDAFVYEYRPGFLLQKDKEPEGGGLSGLAAMLAKSLGVPMPGMPAKAPHAEDCAGCGECKG